MADHDVQSEILQRLARVETKIIDMDHDLDQDLSRTTHANESIIEAMSMIRNNSNRLERIEDNQKWMWRTIAGAVLVAVVGFVLNGGLHV